MRDFTATGYFIHSARAEHIPALAVMIELVAAQLFRGHAPESVLAETQSSARSPMPPAMGDSGWPRGATHP